MAQIKFAKNIVMDHESTFTWFEYQIMEGLIKSSTGSIDALLKKIERTPAWYFRARKNASLKVRDLETICQEIGAHPSELFRKHIVGSMADENETIYGGTAAISHRIGDITHLLAGSQKEFAKRTGINTSHLSYVINQAGEPGLLTVMRILRTFPNVSARWLLFGQGNTLADSETLETMKRSLADKEKIIELLQKQLDSATG